MRKTTLPFLFCCLLFASLSAWGQDTTSFRFISFSDGGEVVLFRDDSTNLYYSPLNANASYNAVFHHPSDGDLYCLHDTVYGVGRRDIYKIDPFSGQMTFVFSPSATYLAAACVGPNGIVYAVTGHGAGTPGIIYAIDIVNQTESLFATTDFTFGGNNPALNISYYPTDDELWLFGGSNDTLIRIDLGTQVETREPLYLAGDGTIKATYFDGSRFWLASDLSYTLDPLSGAGVVPSTFSVPDYLTDFEMLDLVGGADTLGICSGDSATLRSRFQFDDYFWFRNDTLVANNARNLNVGQVGTYRLLAQYDNNGGFYMWSETVEVVANIAPTAGFGQSADTILEGQSVTFTDSSLNADDYHWDFGDGAFSSQTSPTHVFATAGTYTVMQVVQNGPCRDTTYGVVVVLPLVGMADAASRGQLAIVAIAPNPSAGAATIHIWSAMATEAELEVLDLRGGQVARVAVGPLAAGATTVRWDGLGDSGQPLSDGLYLLRLRSPLGQQVARLVVAR